MLVTLPVCKKDAIEQARLFEWIGELGDCKRHTALIVADPAAPFGSILYSLKLAKQIFAEASLSLLPHSIDSWPEGPNALFLLAAEQAPKLAPGMPWLFLEPDAIPLRKGWLDDIAKEYATCGRPYLGSLVRCDASNFDGLSHYLNGVAVYPSHCFQEVFSVVSANMRKAFDLSISLKVMNRCADSKLFCHLWGEKDNPPEFACIGQPGTKLFSFDWIPKSAVLFHRDKKQTLISLLRRMNVTSQQRTFIQLGRFGDLILLLPAMRHIYETTGARPRIIVANDYASVLEGVSYVEPVPINVHWWMGMPEARELAQRKYGGGTVLQCYAHNWGIDLSRWPNFMASMHDRTGVPMELFHSLPLIFDRRSEAREKAALRSLVSDRPFVLVNCSGHSSPFSYKPQLLTALFNLRSRVKFIDLDHVRLFRIFDLLGLMNAALGTITIDTATLHLAHGSLKPYVAFTVDGWTSSTPRGKCVLEVKYSKTMNRLNEVVETVRSWL